MATFRVLLVGTNKQLPDNLRSSIDRDSGQEVVAEATSAIADAITRVSDQGFDAVVCWVEREDELAGVIRIRKTRLEQPIVVLTPLTDPDFIDRATRAGATRIASSTRDSSAISEDIRLAVQSGALRRELAERSRWVRQQAGETRVLAEKTYALVQQALDTVGQRQKTFVPLLVEDDPDQAFLMVRAFQKADVLSPLPIMKTGEDAISYLSKVAVFEDRAQSLFPSLILLDLNLPGISGLDVLEWIRKKPEFSRLPVVMLSSSNNPEQIDRAYKLGANSFLFKPASFDSLVELVLGVKRYWGTINYISDL